MVPLRSKWKAPGLWNLISWWACLLDCLSVVLIKCLGNYIKHNEWWSSKVCQGRDSVAPCATGFSKYLWHTILEKLKLFFVCSIADQSTAINNNNQLTRSICGAEWNFHVSKRRWGRVPIVGMTSRSNLVLSVRKCAHWAIQTCS